MRSCDWSEYLQRVKYTGFGCQNKPSRLRLTLFFFFGSGNHNSLLFVAVIKIFSSILSIMASYNLSQDLFGTAESRWSQLEDGKKYNRFCFDSSTYYNNLLLLL